MEADSEFFCTQQTIAICNIPGGRTEVSPRHVPAFPEGQRQGAGNPDAGIVHVPGSSFRSGNAAEAGTGIHAGCMARRQWSIACCTYIWEARRRVRRSIDLRANI